ncbi:MAG: hypothetical protein JSW62_05265 [Thermoplasmatales archaeon]|nr:MAG: hypothetical protein JSW62_05265 [Thermoplasmatales archaeon]
MNKINRLKGLACYLSGPIDFEKDKGHGWRDDLTPFLQKKNVRVFNPLKHSFYGTDSVDTIKRPKMQELLDVGDFHSLRDEVKEINHWDLRALDLSSFVIVNYNIDVIMCGTMEEIFTANKQTKPVLLMVGNKIKKLSKWMFGRFPPEHMFTSWEALKFYLDNIDHGPESFMSEADTKRWLFFDGDHMTDGSNQLQPKKCLNHHSS